MKKNLFTIIILFVNIFACAQNISQPLLPEWLSQTTDQSPVTENMNGKTPVISGNPSYKDASVLSSGTWYKVKLSKSGIYKISYELLSSWGISVDNIDPLKIRVFGNNTGMLNEFNAVERPDDLLENAIYVNDGGDGIFGPGDYFLFYGTSPDQWKLNPFRKSFEHVKNLYTDYSCYFLNFNEVAGKRIQEKAQSTLQPNTYSHTFSDYAYYENDSINFLKSGRMWFGENFDNIITNFSLPTFSFPNLVTGNQLSIRIQAISKSAEETSFDVLLGDESIVNCPVSLLSPSNNNIYANKKTIFKKFTSSSSDLGLKIRYNFSSAASLGWLDFIELNATRQLHFDSGQLCFRDVNTVGYQKVSQFSMQFTDQQPVLWEITHPENIQSIVADREGDSLRFVISTDSIKEFVAFDFSQFYEPEYVEQVANQNLHSLTDLDYVIICPEEFYQQAERLMQLHKEHDNLTGTVVLLNQIYNEFSSGSPDITAIRDFVRMLYLKPDSSSCIKYLLLFGDGSFDPKNRYPNNNNFIPTFQSDESLAITSSYVTDDYFGLMDFNEGDGASGNLDIGIGRIPVISVAEANDAVDKVKRYMTSGSKVMKDWRNVICFMADDEDSNLYFDQAEEMSQNISDNYPELNIDKVYLDAFKQLNESEGQSYPGAHEAFNNRVDEGALIVNYTGHGSELGLTGEGVLTLRDIEAWGNNYSLPLFITATCEFSRFDDPDRVSAGERIILNQNGGIALFTTTRATFAGSNFILNKRCYNYVFEKNQDGNYYRLGDFVRLSKTPSSVSYRNFVLLGDPALQLAYPQYNVVTKNINGVPAESMQDTIKALEHVTVSGQVNGLSDAILDSYNGKLYVKVFDKPLIHRTLANDPKSYKEDFYIQNTLLFNGEINVIDGVFTFDFLTPRDMDLSFGYGKISYYATDTLTDANGFYNKIALGGIASDQGADVDGPEILAYLNDTTFTSGKVVSQKPYLIIKLQDINGINVLGNGIGHDIVATLDHESYSTVALNDYYTSLSEDNDKGVVVYQLDSLDEGTHSLKIKAWDLYNNSSEKEIEFTILNQIALKTINVRNHPNPFSNNTWFDFSHNLFNTDLDVLIEIYNLSGMQVKTIGPVQMQSEGYVISPIQWDGKDNNGADLADGMYIYKVKILESKSNYIETGGKLILLKQ